MTRERLIQLAERRARLVERARAERESLAALIGRTDEAASWLATGRKLLDELRKQPLIVAAGAAFLIALRPRRALGWIAKGWSLWRLYRGARRWWLRFAAMSGTTGTPAGSR